MLKLRDFKDIGYTVSLCSESAALDESWATYLIQKACRDTKGKLMYYVNIYLWDSRLWSKKIPALKVNYKGYACKIQLYRDDITFDIQINKDNLHSPSTFEEIAHEIWCNMDMDYDHYND